jgi:hypothetical protein
MFKSKKIAHFLLILQLLQIVGGGSHLRAKIADAPEIISQEIPSSATFKAVQKQAIRVDFSQKKKKVTSIDASIKNLEKNLTEKPTKNTSTRLRNNIFNFFINTSPKTTSLMRFSKPRDWQDLQIFEGKKTLLQSCSRTELACGEVFTAGLLVHRPPIQAAIDRRDFISGLLTKQEVNSKLKNSLARFAADEETFFSMTMQDEDPALRVSVDDLKPGYMLTKTLNTLKMPHLSTDPNFIRFHALFTQKTAHYLWNPLKNQLALGNSFLIIPFIFALNGIARTLITSYFRFMFYEYNNNPIMRGRLLESLNELQGMTDENKASRVFNAFMACASTIFVPRKWFFSQVFPVSSPLKPLECASSIQKSFKSLLCLVNDLFLWNTNELRLAYFSRQVTNRPPNQGLADGPHLSWWANSQFHPTAVYEGLFAALSTAHEAYFKKQFSYDTKTSTDSSGSIEDFVAIADEYLATISERIGGNQVANFIREICTDFEAHKNAPNLLTTYKNYTKWSLKTAWYGLSKILFRSTSLSEIDQAKAIIPTERTDQEKLSSQIISVFKKYKDSPVAAPEKDWHPAFLKFFAWLCMGYFFSLWIDKAQNPKSKVAVLDKIIFSTTKPAMTLISSVSEVSETLKKNEHHFIIPKSLTTKLKLFEHMTTNQNQELISYAQGETFKKKTGHKLFDHTGIVRRSYDLIQTPEAKKLLSLGIHILAELDSYISVSKLVDEYSEGDNKVSPVHFIKSNEPFLNAKNAWFPLFGKESIGSDILMGNGHASNILLTGRNGGGKSILLKNIVFNIMFAHTFGYAFATMLMMAPISELLLHLNSLDDAASGKSRWVAEAEAIVAMIKAASTKRSDRYTIFAAGDELGDGTAAEASINVMKKLLTTFSGQKKVLSVTSSHLQPLTELEKYIPSLENYLITPQRKLEKGINRTNIAMAIFEKFSNSTADENGFAAQLARDEEQDSNFDLVQ